MSRGRNANQGGSVAENLLADVMRGLWLVFERQKYMGETIYRTRLYVDFVLHNVAAFPDGLIIESKWQDVHGTIDEKFPYLVENIRLQYPLPTIVVVHGGGCRDGAIAWLRERVDGRQFVDVFTLEQFVSWAIRVEKLTPKETGI